MKTTAQLREAFLKFFEKHEHRRVRSHSIIPPADPTLLFINAGMVQFKEVFIGNKAVDYKRATSSQKCLRVSGKHNDLENVGRTARHHTFFEMLGNFSFGDYFKKDAIQFAYDFLVNEVGLDPNRLYYSVFGGDEADGLGVDEEAKKLWMETAKVGPERIYEFGKKDNFWAMGETGPCGPCSEIMYDRGPGPWACGEEGCDVGCDCDRYIEIWNLVFMQYERKTPGGKLIPLPAPSIDTGMGLERLVAVVQEKATNYDTDAFMPIIEGTLELYRKERGEPIEYLANADTDVALRVIADHARSAAVLVADGVYPDNEGRGYIARLLVRRAIRFGRKMGFQKPFFFKACDIAVDILKEAYPELEEKRALIERVISTEEENFSLTFDEGRRMLEEEMERLEKAGKNTVSGDFLFTLHDERGFQPDLVEVIAEESGFGIDKAGYQRKMEEKKQASVQGSSAEGQLLDDVFKALQKQHGDTLFLGYDVEEAQAATLGLFVKRTPVSKLNAGEVGLAVFDQTPFYAESGGQVPDFGTITWDNGLAQVIDVQKHAGNIFVHHLKVEKGTLKPDQKVALTVDHQRRSGIRAHHSATHLLHWALETVLGEHVKQEGSLVKEKLLRFDVRHFSPLTREEIVTMESMMARKVVENSAVETQVDSLDNAVQSGAKAFFDEKYGSDVRVVTMGDGASRELCGGTHVARTGDIGMIRIIRQEAVSAGVRRLYAVAHNATMEFVHERDELLLASSEILKTSVDDLPAKAKKTLERIAELEREVKSLERKLLEAASGSGGDGQEIIEFGEDKIAIAYMGESNNGRIREMSDMLRDKIVRGFALVGGNVDGKLLFVFAKTKETSANLHCGKIVKELADLMGARGGGKPDFGQAGGGNPDLWNQGVNRLKEIVG